MVLDVGMLDAIALAIVAAETRGDCSARPNLSRLRGTRS
jgi:hypothetical protein